MNKETHTRIPRRLGIAAAFGSVGLVIAGCGPSESPIQPVVPVNLLATTVAQANEAKAGLQTTEKQVATIRQNARATAVAAGTNLLAELDNQDPTKLIVLANELIGVTPTPDATKSPEPTATTAVPTATPTPEATATVRPIVTPVPTATPTPTETPVSGETSKHVRAGENFTARGTALVVGDLLPTDSDPQSGQIMIVRGGQVVRGRAVNAGQVIENIDPSKLSKLLSDIAKGMGQNGCQGGADPCDWVIVLNHRGEVIVRLDVKE